LTWGGGDFVGGLAARRISHFQVVALAALSGLAVFVPIGILRGEGLPSTSSALWALAAGLSGAVGVAALYAGLARGSAAVIAPTATVIGASSLSGNLGPVTVTDNQGTLAHAWTATVSSTDFTTGVGGANKTVTKDNVSYTPGTITSSGIGAAVGTPALTLATSASVVTATAVIGAMSANWDPTVSVTIPSSVIAGTYSGTVTHSVS